MLEGSTDALTVASGSWTRSPSSVAPMHPQQQHPRTGRNIVPRRACGPDPCGLPSVGPLLATVGARESQTLTEEPTYVAVRYPAGESNVRLHRTFAVSLVGLNKPQPDHANRLAKSRRRSNCPVTFSSRSRVVS